MLISRSLSRGCKPIEGSSKNVEHADQAAADLPGQPNPLRFAAGERRGRAVERQIVEPDVGQKAQTSANLLEHFGGDGRLRVVEHQLREESLCFVDRQPATLLGSESSGCSDKTGVCRGNGGCPGLRVESLARRSRGSELRS